MRHCRRIVYYLVYSLAVIGGMNIICRHINSAYVLFDINISFADMLLWCLYKGIYVSYVMPLVYIFFYNRRLKRLTDVHLAVRGQSRYRIILMQEMYIVKLGVINAVLCMAGMSVSAFEGNVDFYNLSSADSMFYLITQKTFSGNRYFVYAIIFYYMFLQTVFILSCVLLVYVIFRKKALICLGIAITWIMEFTASGLVVSNSNCYKVLLNISAGYAYMLRIPLLLVIVGIMILLIYRNREYR